MTGGAVLLISGDAGVGKTVLLDAAGDLASAAGARIVRSAGVQFEIDVSYSGLNQLLLPLLSGLQHLNEDHRNALMVALGLAAGAPPDRLVVGTASLSLLHGQAADSPLFKAQLPFIWDNRPRVSYCQRRGEYSRFIQLSLSNERTSANRTKNLVLGRLQPYQAANDIENIEQASIELVTPLLDQDIFKSPNCC